MAKVAPDAMIDAALDYVIGSSHMVVCSGSPASYGDVFTNALAMWAITSGCFTKADDTSGRKVTISARTSGSITTAGSALAVAFVKTSDTTLRYVTTATEQWLNAGGTVDTPAFKISIADPT